MEDTSLDTPLSGDEKESTSEEKKKCKVRGHIKEESSRSQSPLYIIVSRLRGMEEELKE